MLPRAATNFRDSSYLVAQYSIHVVPRIKLRRWVLFFLCYRERNLDACQMSFEEQQYTESY
jgi:hypothetical protein